VIYNKFTNVKKHIRRYVVMGNSYRSYTQRTEKPKEERLTAFVDEDYVKFMRYMSYRYERSIKSLVSEALYLLLDKYRKEVFTPEEWAEIEKEYKR